MKTAELLVTIGADTSDLTQALDGAGRGIKEFGATMAVVGAAVTGALMLITERTVSFGHDIYEMSQRTGVSTTTLTEFRLALEKNGASLDDFALGMRKFSQNMVKSADDSGEAKKALTDLGISATDSTGQIRPMSEVFLDIADKFAGMADGAEKTAAAVALFGRGGMSLIPTLNLGRAGLEAEAEAARKLGIVIGPELSKSLDDAKDAQVELKAAFDGVAFVLSESLVPFFKAATNAATDIVSAFTSVSAECQPLTDFLMQMVGAAGLLATGIGAVTLAYAGFLKNAAAIKGAIETIRVATYLLMTENLSLVGVLKGLPFIAAAAFTGWKIGDLINELSGLKKKFYEVDWTVAGGKNAAAMQELRDAVALLNEAAGKQVVTFFGLVKEFGSVENAVDGVKEKYKDQIAAALGLREKTENLTEAMKAFQMKTRDATRKELDDLQAKFLLISKSGQVSYEKLVLMAQGLKETADTFRIKLNPVVDAYANDYLAKATEEALAMADKHINELVPALKLTLSDLNKVGTASLGAADKFDISTDQIKIDIVSLDENLKTYLGDFVEETDNATSEMGNIFREFTDDLAKSFGEAFSSIIKDGLNFSNIFKNLFQGIANVVSTTIGKIAVEAFKSLTEAISNATGASKELAASFAMFAATVSIGILKKLAEAFHLIEVEADLTTDALKRYNDALNEGLLLSTVAASSLKKSVDDLAGKPLRTLEDILKALDRIPKALADLVSSIDGTGGSLEGMGEIALITFEAMLSKGISFTEAIKKMKEPLAALRDKYAELGITADPVLERLFAIVGVTEKHEKLFTAIEANRTILEALGQSGFLTASTLDTLASNTNDFYNNLIAAGLTSEEALRAIAPTLEKIYKYSKLYGITIDENTQKLIDQAKSAGLLEKETLTVQDTILAAIGLLIEALGKDVPEAMQKAIDKMRDIGNEAQKAASDTSSYFQQAADDIQEYFNNISIPIYTGVDGAAASGLPSYQRGGIAWTPQLAQVGEVPEAIIPLSRLGGRGGAADFDGFGPTINITYAPTIQAMDSQDVYRFMAGRGREALVEIIRSNVRGVAREISEEARKY